MVIEIVSENKKCGGADEALTELAFAHYPTEVRIGGDRRVFDSFDCAKAFVWLNCEGNESKLSEIQPNGK